MSSPARVLLLHNRYRAAGGEERVIAELETLLVSRGHAVARCERDSAEAGRARAAHALLRGGVDEDAVAAAVRAHRADVVHAHNVHPLLGWRALAAARAAGARVVLHLHNHRLVCSIGIAFRDGAPCHACHGRDTRPGVRFRCRASLPEAVAYAAGLARQQPRLLAEPDALVAVSEALRAELAGFGIAAPMAVLPNFVSRFTDASHAGDGAYALAVGRLVPDKGFDVAVRAAVAAGVPLRIAGAGPEEARLRALAVDGDVRFLGQLDAAALAVERAGAALLLAPSRAEDPCPMSVVEALADGLPVVGSTRGGIPELVGSEWVVAPDDIEGWAATLRTLWDDPARRAVAGAAALTRARAHHSPDVYYERLTRVYAGSAVV